MSTGHQRSKDLELRLQTRRRLMIPAQLKAVPAKILGQGKKLWVGLPILPVRGQRFRSLHLPRVGIATRCAQAGLSRAEICWPPFSFRATLREVARSLRAER